MTALFSIQKRMVMNKKSLWGMENISEDTIYLLESMSWN